MIYDNMEEMRVFILGFDLKDSGVSYEDAIGESYLSLVEFSDIQKAKMRAKMRLMHLIESERQYNLVKEALAKEPHTI